MKFFSFALTFVVLFFLTYLFLGMVDVLPEPRGGQSDPVAEVPAEIPQDTHELPVRVVAQDIGLNSEVLNPQSLDIDVLNAAVDKAAMRWPTSGLLGADGTVALFGHSSHLPIVHNQAFKIFNGIEKLKAGQTISVYSATTEYRYKVVGVRFAKAAENTLEDRVDLPSNGKFLALITCDNFGAKSDRWVVTADFAGAYAI